MPPKRRTAAAQAASNTIHPYRMHVSQRYLELTKKKLELTRLPREPQGMGQQSWNLGVSKSELEPLVDYWMEEYDWRVQETHCRAQDVEDNDTLPQFRALVNGARMHFVHRKSPSATAVPLLFVHGFPESFIAVSHMIDDLCNPAADVPAGDFGPQAFHVVAPSIPGFGFSDTVPEEGNNYQSTAHLFDGLMKELGYKQYIVHGSGWGFKVCRVLALAHSDSCIAIHTVNPDVPAPRSGYGFTPEDMALGNLPIVTPGLTPPLTPGMLGVTAERPQTSAYALCDSPPGLLAYMLEAMDSPLQHQTSHSPHSVGTSSSSHSPTTSRSPGSPPSVGTPSMVGTPLMSGPPSLLGTPGPTPGPNRQPEIYDPMNPWTPTALINWTMIYWLPGPEVALRWLVNSAALTPPLWTMHSNVPLGITQFREIALPGTRGSQTPPQWLEAYHRVAMVRRREGRVRFAAWERPAEVVEDIRELAGILGNAFGEHS